MKDLVDIEYMGQRGGVDRSGHLSSGVELVLREGSGTVDMEDL